MQVASADHRHREILNLAPCKSGDEVFQEMSFCANALKAGQLERSRILALGSSVSCYDISLGTS